MFQGLHAKKAAAEHKEALTKWQEQRDAYKQLLDVAEHFSGSLSDEIVLGPGEAVFYKVTGTSLVEERRGAGHWQGHSSGISIPVGTLGGHTVRYRVGSSRGHYVQGAPRPTAIDSGTTFVTNNRVVFIGKHQTRECAFAKLIGFRHDDADGSTTFSISNRQKPTTVHYGPGLSASFDFRLDLALAHFRGTLNVFVSQLKRDLAQTEGTMPVAPGVLPT
jgi:hypothetical protein